MHRQQRFPICSPISTSRACVLVTRLVLFAAFLSSASIAPAQQPGQKTFSSPGDAVLAAYNALKSGDNQTLNSIFGSAANQILHTGDDVADKNAVKNFLQRYDQMHRVVIEPDQSATLYIGAENWPTPIPMVKNSTGAWYFDTDAGVKEILYRRVGTNENDAIDTLHSLVEAQHDYAFSAHDGNNPGLYAIKFISDPGKQNGLYWKTADNEDASPIGSFLADATSEGYTLKQGQPTPFHGYYFRLLTKQGPSAKGGARDYLVNGKLTRGFAFVAYPSDYRNSGVMTFIVNQDGVVRQKDLGPDTAKLAAAMTEYNPDTSWKSAD